MGKESDQFIDLSYGLAVVGGGSGGGGGSQLGKNSLLTAQQELHRRQQTIEQMAYMKNSANPYIAPVPIQTGEDNIQMDRKLLLIKR